MAGPPQKLRIRNVRKAYGSVVALNETDLDLAEGEFLTLLGPSGSGKTTLLMTVAGLIAPDAGEIWIDGKLASYLPVHHRDIGMVFQNYALFPHLTVYDNIAFPLRMRRVSGEQIKRDVTFALETVRLPGLAHRYPRELSGGQQQRVALARCFVYRPSIILMDEPLGALDKKLRDEMQLEIKQLHSELGITVLYVTHDQEEAMVMSDRICLMNQGAIEQIGTAAELYFRPHSLFAAQFLGDSNVLSVTITGSNGSRLELSGPGGTRLSVAQADSIGKNTTAHIMARPESLRVLESGEPADNILEGTVTDIIMLGGVSRCFVRLDSGEMVSSKSLTRAGGPRIERGRRVRVGWSAADTVLLTRSTMRKVP
jgi:putative spermidine/putrescine transport system ATP-binding protein